MAEAASAAHAEAGTTAGAAVVRARLIDVHDRVHLHMAGRSPCHPAIKRFPVSPCQLLIAFALAFHSTMHSPCIS